MFRIPTGLMGIAAGLAIGILGTAAPMAHAQGRDVIRCGSDDGRFARCQVPWRDAELIRQESNSPCTRGQTWGVDRGGLVHLSRNYGASGAGRSQLCRRIPAFGLHDPGRLEHDCLR